MTEDNYSDDGFADENFSEYESKWKYQLYDVDLQILTLEHPLQNRIHLAIRKLGQADIRHSKTLQMHKIAWTIGWVI